MLLAPRHAALLYRTDGPRYATGTKRVAEEWEGYFEALGKGEITDFRRTDVRYAYEPESLETDGAYVFSIGRIFQETRTNAGETVSEKGRFIRVYQRHAGAWTLVFDFADIPMRVGCDPDEVDVDCPPGQEPEGTKPPVSIDTGGSKIDKGMGLEVPLDAKVGYADVLGFFAELKGRAGDAPHDAFWKDTPYDEFVAFEFPASWDNTDETIKLIEIGNWRESNIIKGLIDGKDIKVKGADGTMMSRNIQRMPKGAPPMDPKKVALIAAWIAQGCPEHAGAGKVPSGGTGGGDAGTGTSKDDEPKGDMPKGDTPKATGPAIGYADVQRYFKELEGRAGDAPHEKFWADLPHKEFVEFKFPFSWEDTDSTVKLIEVWDSNSSNLIKALIDGKGITVKKPDGRIVTQDIQRMPKGAPPMAPDRVAAIAAWIDAGCPEVAGGPSPWPKNGAGGGGGAQEDGDGAAKGENPGGEPPPDPPPSPPVADIGFEDVQKIFKRIKQRAMHAPHGEFWRELPYDEFVTFEFPQFMGEDAMVRLVIPYDAEGSNLIKALKDGKGVTIVMPDGRVVKKDIARMPKGKAPIPAEDLQKLIAWVDAGCPEHAGKPSKLPRPKPGDGAPPSKAPAPDAPKAAPGGFPAAGGG